jgi:hypothetical protein
VSVHAYTVRAGSTGKLLLVQARDAESRPKTGLRADLDGAEAGFVREGDRGGRSVRLQAGSVGTWSPGGFVEVDAELLPGVYQFGAPDEMLAPGSTRAVLVLQFPGAVMDPVEVDMVAFDPQDSVRLGMTALSPEARVEALRGAFPRLAAEEIEERSAMREPD